MSYTLSGLLTLFRQQADDLETPYFWSDDELYGYLDEAQKEFARGTDWFADTRLHPIAAGSQLTSPSTPTATRMIKVLRATLVSTGRGLLVRTAAQMDAEYTDGDYCNYATTTDWRDIEGTPRYLVTDGNMSSFQVVPSIPATGTADTVKIYGFRLPDTDIIDNTGVLEVTERQHQRVLVTGMKAQAYMKQDAEVNSTSLANSFDDEFNLKIEKIQDQTRRLRKPAGSVRYGGL